MMSDKQQQEEELLILKSILGDDITVLTSENDQFEIDVEFQIPTPFYLRLIDGSNQLSTSIQYLPPLILTIHFHDEYPSSIHSPTFVLSSCYLSRKYLENMCQKLDKIWEHNLSEPIVYQWIACIREQFLSINELCLTNTVINDEHDDPRAMSNYHPNQATYVYDQLINHNRTKEDEKFRAEYHQCPICLTDNIPGRDLIRLYKCHHAFCRSCLYDYSQIHINTGSVQWLLCPDFECQLALLPTEIKIIMNNNQLYDRYERLVLQKTLEQMLDIVWCPRCQQAVLTGDENDKLALCDQCRFAFCKQCKKTYHSQTLCNGELNLMELRNKRREMRRKLQDLQLTTEDEENLLRDFLAAARIENSTRLCPNPRCQVPIEKNEGCNHMFCTRCQRAFNWTDAKDQTAETNILFQHYDNDLDKVQKALESERNEDENVVAQTLGLPSLTKFIVNRAKKCPNITCGKPYIKSGPVNYVICQYCKRGFCFSCGQSISSLNSYFKHACK